MIPEIVNSLKLFESSQRVADDAKRTEIVIQFQQNILDLQAQIMGIHAKYEEMAQAKRDAEEQLVKHRRWEQVAAQYKLEELAPGITAYAYRPAEPATEPFHYACPQCMGKAQRSIMQRPGINHTNYVCQECKLDLRPGQPVYPMAASFPRRRTGRMDGLV